jgi:hypothetical protein
MARHDARGFQLLASSFEVGGARLKKLAPTA